MFASEIVLIRNYSRSSAAFLQRLTFLILLTVALLPALSAAAVHGTAIRETDIYSQGTDTNNNGGTSSSGYDGPAQLPIATVASSMADTPAPGSIISVNAGGSLQTALNNALCGDTIELQAGATFSGVFKFPAKNCDNDHWIIVRTSSADASLPPEGQRLTPCYAGVASLVGTSAICLQPTAECTGEACGFRTRRRPGDLRIGS